MEQELINKMYWQYCKRNQAEAMKAHGITNNYEQEGCFYSAILPNSDREMIAVLGSQEDAPYKMYKPIKLYSVAEMGLIIGRGTFAAQKFHDYVMNKINSGHSMSIALNADFVASFIVEAIRNDYIDVEKANLELGRLQSI